MAKNVAHLLVCVFLMFLFSTLMLFLLSTVVFYQSMSKEVVEGGIRLIYILTGILGGNLYGHIEKKAVRMQEPFLLSLLYCGCFLFVAMVLSKGQPDKNWCDYIIIFLTISLAVFSGYLLSKKRRK